MPLSAQVYKWVLANLMLGVTRQWTSIPSRGEVEIHLITSCYWNWNQLHPDEALSSSADLTLNPQWALAGDIVLYFCPRHFTATVPLSALEEYKWVPVNLMLGVTWQWTSIPFRGGVEIHLITSCYWNRDKLHPEEPLSSCADFTLPTSMTTLIRPE